MPSGCCQLLDQARVLKLREDAPHLPHRFAHLVVSLGQLIAIAGKNPHATGYEHNNAELLDAQLTRQAARILNQDHPHALARLGEAVVFERTAALAFAGLAAVFAIVVAILLHRSIARPIISFAKTMTVLGAGSTDVDVAFTTNRDELGEMARTIDVFRTAMIERVKLEQAAEQTHHLEVERQRHLEGSSRAFRTRVSAVIAVLDREISSMRSTAEVLTSAANSVCDKAQTASEASSGVADNAQRSRPRPQS